MLNNLPILRQVEWKFLIFQLVIIALFCYLYYALKVEYWYFFASFSYSFLALRLRKTIAKSHRHGIMLVRNGNFPAAIPYLERSVAYFKKNQWVDQYRFITLMSSSKFSYKEIALCNLAYCFVQINNRAQAISLYKEVLQQNPNNGFAKTALNMMTANEVKPQ